MLRAGVVLLIGGVGSLVMTQPSVVFAAEPPPAIYEEKDVPEYTLPDPLTMEDGRKVETAEQWKNERRPELFKLFEEQIYGRAPAADGDVQAEVISKVDDALNGKATRKEVRIHLADSPHPVEMTLLMYVPNNNIPAPAFLGYNFKGNHTITDEPDIELNSNWVRSGEGVVEHRSTEATRGTSKSRWPIEMIIDEGFAVGTIYYGDVDPDDEGRFDNGIHPAFYNEGQEQPAADEWGSIAAWAWGLSRALDYLETDDQIDGNRVAVIGHSRLGKTALWAGATDPRFAIVISNNSGCGGAALSRRRFGETVLRINNMFPHWFCDNFTAYNENEAELPVDQHELIALIAPRPVYIASAEEDSWADPKGEFLSAKHADPVYRLLGTDGMGGNAPPEEQPAVNDPVSSGTIGYHIRTGEHDVKDYDWEQYLKFASRHLNK